MLADEQSLLDELLALDSGLTDWEVGFLESLLTQEWGSRLRKKQRKCLSELGEKMDLGGLHEVAT